MTSLSLCMIVKNEGKMLEHFLTHHEPLVDEIILVDTGSTDSTKKIAAKFPKVKIIDVPWEDDFSKARNASIKQATKDWILVLDPDEEISIVDFPRIKNAIASKKAKAFVLSQVNYIEEGKLPQVPANQSAQIPIVRLFENHQNIAYQYRVHEVVELSIIKQKLPLMILGVPIHHHGFKKRSKEELEKKYDYYLSLIEKETKEFPKDPKPWFELGCNYFFKQQYEKAIELFEKSIKMGAVNATIWDNLGHAYYNTKNFEKAFSCYKHAIILSPSPSFAFLNLGLFLMKDKHEDLAMRAFAESIKQDPTNVVALNNAAFLFMKNNQDEKAETLLKEGIERTKDKKQASPLYNNLALLYLKTKRLSDAEKILKEAMQSNDQDAQIYANLAQVYMNLGKKAEARAIIDKAEQKKLQNPILTQTIEQLKKEG